MKSLNRSVRTLLVSLILGTLSSGSLAAGAVTSVTFDASQIHRAISPALNAQIEQMLAAKKYHESLDKLDAELAKDPKNTELLYRKAAIYADIEQWNNAINTCDQILALEPSNKKALSLRKKMEEYKAKEPHNEIGFDEDLAHVSDLDAIWQYSSLHYYRLTDYGKMGARVNYAKRLGTTGEQYQLDLNPQITDKIAMSILMGYANETQYLFPNLQYRVDAYFTLPNAFEFAVGQGTSKFIRFNNQKMLLYTVSLGKYFGNYFVWVRPTEYTPKNVQYYELGLRRYFTDANTYITFLLSGGRLQDIGNLPPLDQMVILNQYAFGVYGQYAVCKNIFLKAGAGYTKQLYQSGLHRELTDGSLGIVWQFS